MRICAVSYKLCWQDGDGNWLASGGFSSQMAAIASLFEEMTLVICRGRPQAGGTPLPRRATVIPLRQPPGTGSGRKLAMLGRLPYYIMTIARHIDQADVVHIPLPGDVPLIGMITAVVLRKRLLVRYGGSWNTTSQTTFGERVTRLCMRWLA